LLRLESLEANERDAVARRTEAESEAAGLRTHLSEAMARHTEVLRELTERSKRITDLEQAEAALRSSIEEHQRVSHSQAQQMRSMEEQLNSARQRYDTLQGRLTQATKALGDSERELEALRKQGRTDSAASDSLVGKPYITISPDFQYPIFGANLFRVRLTNLGSADATNIRLQFEFNVNTPRYPNGTAEGFIDHLAAGHSHLMEIGNSNTLGGATNITITGSYEDFNGRKWEFPRRGHGM